MASITDQRTLELEEITARFKALLEPLEGSESPHLLTPDQMSDLLSDLMRAGGCMRAMHSESSNEFSFAVGACRQQIERLRSLLPSIHSALLREQSRLAQERERLGSITAWAQVSSQTFR